MPVLSETLAGYREYLTSAQQTLVRGQRHRGRALRRIRAATGHALAFTTWRSLTQDHCLDDAEAAALMSDLALAAGSTTPD